MGEKGCVRRKTPKPQKPNRPNPNTREEMGKREKDKRRQRKFSVGSGAVLVGVIKENPLSAYITEIGVQRKIPVII